MEEIFFIIFFCAAVFLPNAVFADAPPPPPITVLVQYENRDLSDPQFYATILTCPATEGDRSFRSILNGIQDKNSPEHEALVKLDIAEKDQKQDCSWGPSFLPSSDGYSCKNSLCMFDWALGDFRIATYIPSLDKTFISNPIGRSYKGYYGRDTDKFYTARLTKDGQSVITNRIGVFDKINTTNKVVDKQNVGVSSDSTRFYGVLYFGFSSLILTLIIELIAGLIFALLKKFPKRILLGIVIGNLVSVPLLWLLVTSNYWLLMPGEIGVVIFEAWMIKLFSGRKMNWKWCLIFSLTLNVLSFVFGPVILAVQP